MCANWKECSSNDVGHCYLIILKSLSVIFFFFWSEISQSEFKNSPRVIFIFSIFIIVSYVCMNVGLIA